MSGSGNTKRPSPGMGSKDDMKGLGQSCDLFSLGNATGTGNIRLTHIDSLSQEQFPESLLGILTSARGHIHIQDFLHMGHPIDIFRRDRLFKPEYI
jgi:hypothetical protein